MSEQVLITFILATQGIIVAVIGKISIDTRRAKKATKVVQDQVANTHVLPNGEPYNLRDNIDHNQAAVLGEIRGMRRDIGRLDQRDIQRGIEMREMHHKIDELGTADRGAADRITNLEDTLDLRKDRS